MASEHTPTPCIEWTGAASDAGYGRRRWKGKTAQAHRVAYENTHGEIPIGLFVCHRCDNPRCINVDHLFLGSPRDNVLDMVAKGRHHSWGSDVTHCPQGHEYSEENTRTYKGIRYCRACQNQRSKDYQKRKRAALALAEEPKS